MYKCFIVGTEWTAWSGPFELLLLSVTKIKDCCTFIFGDTVDGSSAGLSMTMVGFVEPSNALFSCLPDKENQQITGTLN